MALNRWRSVPKWTFERLGVRCIVPCAKRLGYIFTKVVLEGELLACLTSIVIEA